MKNIVKTTKTKNNIKENTTSILSFIFYNYSENIVIDNDLLKIIDTNKINYYYFKNDPKNELYNNKLEAIHLNSLQLNESVVFFDILSENLTAEITNWIQSVDKITLNKKFKLYSSQNLLKAKISHSICVPQTIAINILSESFEYTLANNLLHARVSLLEKSSNLIPINDKLLSNKKNTSSTLSLFSTWIENNYKIPLKLSSVIGKSQNLKFEHPIFKLIWVSLLLISFVYIVIGSQNVGMHSDEHRYMSQAAKVINFYKTLGKDTSACVGSGIDPLHYGIQIIDNFTYGFGKIFDIQDNYKYRHFIVALICFFTIYFTSLIAVKLTGYRLAIICVFHMILSPIFIGNGFNNERDFIGVLGLVLSMYGMFSLVKIYPVLHPKYLLAVFMGLLFIGGQRVAGGAICLLFISTWVLAGIILNKKGTFGRSLQEIKKWIVGIAITCISAFILIILIWPYGLISPIKHFWEVLKFSNKVTVGLNQVFEGKFLLSTNMPPHYLIKYLLITLPAAILLGLALCLLFLRKMKENRVYIGLLSFVFIFVISYAFIKLSTMYGSWRQFLIIFPFIAISASVGWDILFTDILKIKKVSFILIFLLLIFLHPLQYVIRNHPFEYLYYNEFVGGTSNAYGKYELDYAFTSIKQGSEWLQNYIRKYHPKGSKIIIASNGINELTEYFKGFDDSISLQYTRYYEKSAANWDYAIFPNVYIHPYQLINNIFPSKDSLHFIKIDGKPICMIYKRNNKTDYEATQAILRNDANNAISKLSEYTRYNPKSEWAWFQLAYIYAQNNDWNTAQRYLTESFKFHPEFQPAKTLQGLLYLNTNQHANAKPIFTKLLESKYDLGNTYVWLGQCFEAEKNWRKALENYGFALGAGNTQKTTYAKIANCFRQLGDVNQANKYSQMAN